MLCLATCLAVIWYYSNSCRCPATKLMHLFSLYFQLFCTGWAKVNDATLHFCLQQLNATIRTFSLFQLVIIASHMLSWHHLACNNRPPVSMYWRNNKYDWIQRSNECRFCMRTVSNPGVVRSVCAAERSIYVITPVKPSVLESVNCIQCGAVSLPKSLRITSEVISSGEATVTLVTSPKKSQVQVP